MFGKLKDKLKSALQVFSTKTEEEVLDETLPEQKEEKQTAKPSKERVKEIEEIPEKFNPATLKYEPDLEKLQDIEKKLEDKKAVKETRKEKKQEEQISKPEDITPTPEELLKETRERFKDDEKPKKPKVKTAEQILAETEREPIEKPIVTSPEIIEAKELPIIEEENILSKKETAIKGVKITYFVHGTTTDNEQDIATGWNDGDLSKIGIEQAKKLATFIPNKKFAVVFCSDLKRAVDSAKLGFGDRYEIIEDERLRECNYGDWNGKEKDWDIRNFIEKPYPNGESYKDVEKRVASFCNYLYEHYSGKHIAIVAHQAPQLAFEVLLQGKTWEQAISGDWRNRKAWQPGWEYAVEKALDVSKQEKKGFFKKLFFRKEEPEERIEEEKQEVQREQLLVEEPTQEEIKEPEEKKSFFSKVTQAVTTKKISAEKFEELFWDLELALLENNVSVEVIEKIKEDLKEELVDKPLPRDVSGKIEDTLKNTLTEILSYEPIDLLQKIKEKPTKPYVIAFFGINGSGKTTSIAKLTHYLQKNNLSVVLAACDTFRAAAIQQLEEHANRLNVKMIKHDYKSDAAAVAFDAIKYAEKNSLDVVLIDTAGRLHSNTNLMAELEKIIRVTKPDLKIFVGESITGNDCIEQARRFSELVNLDGVILTKADVDEKGGAPLSIAYTIKKPILFLGTGQEYNDLEKFDAGMILKRLGF